MTDNRLLSSTAKVGIMIDTESLGLGSKSVVTQFAFVAFALDDPESVLRETEEYLPIQPQMDLGRQIESDTLLWLVTQPEDVRKRMFENRGNDIEELFALLRSIERKFRDVTEDGAIPYEVWIRRPQHDVPMIQSLFKDCGLTVPWGYESVNDLATLLNLAGVNKDDVDKSGFTLHTAMGDCRFQIRCYAEGIRRLRSSS